MGSVDGCVIISGHSLCASLVALHALGRCLLNKGELEEAEQFLRNALDAKRRVSPDNKAGIATSECSCSYFDSTDRQMSNEVLLYHKMGSD